MAPAESIPASPVEVEAFVEALAVDYTPIFIEVPIEALVLVEAFARAFWVCFLVRLVVLGALFAALVAASEEAAAWFARF